MPIIDAGVRVDPNDSTCTEGMEKGYFCKKADGTPFVAAVWPGKAYFADFLRPEVREWFGHKYKALTDCGIEGFWNDIQPHRATQRKIRPRPNPPGAGGAAGPGALPGGRAGPDD